MITKVLAFVLRESGTQIEILVFDHPNGSTQVPRRTVEADENLEDAVLRELLEESGLRGARVRRAVSDYIRVRPSRHQEDRPTEEQRWVSFWLECREPTPPQWDHVVTDGPYEAGLLFRYRWLKLASASNELKPQFLQALESLVEAVGVSATPTDGQPTNP